MSSSLCCPASRPAGARKTRAGVASAGPTTRPMHVWPAVEGTSLLPQDVVRNSDQQSADQPGDDGYHADEEKRGEEAETEGDDHEDADPAHRDLLSPPSALALLGRELGERGRQRGPAVTHPNDRLHDRLQRRQFPRATPG